MAGKWERSRKCGNDRMGDHRIIEEGGIESFVILVQWLSNFPVPRTPWGKNHKSIKVPPPYSGPFKL